MALSTPNAFIALREQARAESSRAYHGRGILVKRCDTCQLKLSHCICHAITPSQCPVDFILILHRDEVFKPTNTGKLIAQQFPDNTFAFLWDRVSPPEKLIALLQSPERECFIIFPADHAKGHAVTEKLIPNNTKRQTLILLDATWRQSRRMFNASQWLANIACLSLKPEDKALYSTRQAAHDHYLSTAESAALALLACQIPSCAQQLFDTFALFDERYIKMKQNIELTP